MPKLWEKLALFGSLIGVAVSLGFALVCVFGRWSNDAAWMASAGIMAQLAALVQLEVSGLFDKLVEHYADEERYPHGPPSHFTRRFFAYTNPESGRMSAIGYLYQEPKVGFALIVFGTLLQLWSEWL
jgi:hypothetical protein